MWTDSYQSVCGMGHGRQAEHREYKGPWCPGIPEMFCRMGRGGRPPECTNTGEPYA